MLQCNIGGGPGIRRPVGCQKIEAGRPWTHAGNIRQLPEHVFLTLRRSRRLQQSARLKCPGCRMERTRLCAGKTKRAEFVFGTGEKLGWGEVFQACRDPVPDGLARPQRNQLVGDDPEKAFQPGLGMAKRGQPLAGDDGGETRLHLDQPRSYRFKIPGVLQPPHRLCLTFCPIRRKSFLMNRPVFRFAPSPNGLLHLGHAYSALLNARMAEEHGGRLLLRIEDTDEGRCRPEFVLAIFEDLAWLGLRWEEPVRIQSVHITDYEAHLARLWAMGAIYPCFCSRKDAAARGLAARDPDGQPHYCGACRGLSRGEAAARMSGGIIHGWRVNMNAVGDTEAAVWGDAVIAKRPTGSSYHIAVVTDDAAQGVTDVVRGKDIEAATPLHKLLQRLLGLPTPRYIHHDLILDEKGNKLSKSLRSTALRELRQDGVTAADIRARLGFS